MLSFIGADSPAYFDIQGKIEKTGADEITVPPIATRINRQNLKIETSTVLTAGDNDGTFASFTLGGNYYVYACQPASGAEPDFILSQNSTYPDTMPSGDTPTADNTRKIGGFHYGRIRDITDAYNDTASITVNILPNSVWDLLNRPKCDPTGMAKVGDIWVDIYLSSHGAGSWPDQELVSEYDSTPVTGTEGYNWYDFSRMASNVGKRLLTYSEWVQCAYGSPQGHDNDNLACWSDTSNSGRTATGTVEQAVSVNGMVDCAGNVYEWLNEFSARGDLSSGGTWRDLLNTGKDGAEGHGQIYAYDDNHLIALRAGGYWHLGVHCGARAVSLHTRPWNVSSDIGCRLACDSL